MNIICKMFGHRPEPGYYRDRDYSYNSYFKVKYLTTDGINRHHARLETVCRRCKKTFNIGLIHIPNMEKIK